MSLTENTRPALTWDDDKPPRVSVALVCHCGETFTLDQIDEAHAHVRTHLDEEEPS